jgi:hypothetical protein
MPRLFRPAKSSQRVRSKQCGETGTSNALAVNQFAKYVTFVQAQCELEQKKSAMNTAG